MKAVLLLAGLAVCFVGVVLWQRHDFAARTARQGQAIALVQARYDAALERNRALAASLAKQESTHSAYASALSIAAHYRANPPAKQAARAQ
jgi:hypothetical protein